MVVTSLGIISSYPLIKKAGKDNSSTPYENNDLLTKINQTSYTLATLDTVLTVISGETVYLKYEVVSSSSSSSKLAYWNINGTPSIDTTTEKTITISDTYSSSSYKVKAAGNLNIVSSTIRINTLGTLANNIKTFKVGYYKDNDSVTWVGEDTTITALSTDTYHVQY